MVAMSYDESPWGGFVFAGMNGSSIVYQTISCQIMLA